MRHLKILFRQLVDPVTCTYTYIFACNSTKKAVIIDPVIDLAERDTKLLNQLNLDPVYGINTHIHSDHVTGTGELKRRFPNMHSVLSEDSEGSADVLVRNCDIIRFGHGALEVRETPGHTSGCISLVNHQHRLVFTGDCLLIRGCGRTDFQNGNPHKLYNSIQNQLFSLPDDYLIFPAHDYAGFTASTIGEEKQFNNRLNCGEERFVEIMHHLDLPYPVEMQKFVPANRVCGVFDLMDDNTKQNIFGAGGAA